MSRYFPKPSRSALAGVTLAFSFWACLVQAQDGLDKGFLKITVSREVEVFHGPTARARVPQFMTFPATWADNEGRVLFYVGVRGPDLTVRGATITLETSAGSRIPAQLVGIDERISVAVVETDKSRPKPTVFPTRSIPESGTLLFAGLGRDDWNQYAGSVIRVDSNKLIAEREIQVSGLDRVRTHLEGSLVMEKDGRFLGIVTRTRPFEFSKKIRILSVVPAEVIRESVSRIVRTRKSIRAGWLGVTLAPTKPSGVSVELVMPNSPAQQAGLRPGDRIVKMKEQPVLWPDLVSAIQWAGAGAELNFQVERNGRSMRLPVKLCERRDPLPRMSWRMELPEIWRGREIPPEGIRMRPLIVPLPLRIGMELDPIPEQLAKHFKSPTGGGLLVKQVMGESLAERAGFRAGDVLFQINGLEINGKTDVMQILQAPATDSYFEIRFVRDGQQVTRTVMLP